MKMTSTKFRGALSRGQLIRKASYYLGYFLISLGLPIVILVMIWLGVKAIRIYAIYRDMGPHLASLQALVSTGKADSSELDLAQLDESLRSTASGLERLHEELTPLLPLTPYLGWVPIYGGDIQAAPYLLTAGQDVSWAGVILLDRFSPLLEHGSKGEQATILPQFVALLDGSQAELDQAEALLQRAQLNLSQVDNMRLSPTMARWVAPLQRYLHPALSGLEIAKRLPALLGVESPQTYLILTQNSDELRPSGGYITAVGYIVFDQGQIVQFELQDSYAVDRLSDAYPYPPEPLYHYMGAGYWVLRDTGWSPDFPTAARAAIELYELGQDISATGVIAVDQQALSYLLRAVEPIQVEGEQVTGDNVIELMRRHWEPASDQVLDGAWWSQRKSFMVALAETIRQELEQGFGEIRPLVLAGAVQQALVEKHILVYLAEPAAAAFLTKQNWSGSLQPVPGDYLMTVDANVGFNKASAMVEKRLNYQVALTRDGGARAHLNLVYQHHADQRQECLFEVRYDRGYEQNMERCYWDYHRLITPAGAQLLSGPHIVVEGQYLLQGRPTTGKIDTAPLGLNRTSWGQLFVLAPQESISLDYVYTLPPGTAQFVKDHWEYTLYLQKQPGTLEPMAEVAIALPEGARFLQSQPPTQPGAVVTYLIGLRTDQEIVLSYSLP